MGAYILEILLQWGWRRGGEIYWTLADAEAAGRAMLKRRLARQVRILSVNVELQPVAELPSTADGSGNAC
jgi:hypothetical protein